MKIEKHHVGMLVWASLLALMCALLASCNTTTSQQDIQMLQSKYETVYQVNVWNYITCDSTHVYHVRVKRDGQIESTIKIK
jgi:predicted small secreted protein